MPKNWKCRQDAAMPYQPWHPFEYDDLVEIRNVNGESRRGRAHEFWWGYERDNGAIADGVIYYARLLDSDEAAVVIAAEKPEAPQVTQANTGAPHMRKFSSTDYANMKFTSAIVPFAPIPLSIITRHAAFFTAIVPSEAELPAGVIPWTSGPDLNGDLIVSIPVEMIELLLTLAEAEEVYNLVHINSFLKQLGI